ncbi:MAG: lysophospholipid acyltransferase family protein [Nitrospirae bacterium]|nr:lysophospholipid acyltransferase family protein [Nitrospirota bacterium]
MDTNAVVTVKKKRHSRLTGFVQYMTVVILVRVLSLLPYRLASDTGGLIGRLGYLMDKRHRNIALDNLARAFPGMDRQSLVSIAGRVFENLGRSVAEFINLASQKPEELKKQLDTLISIEGMDNLNYAMRKRRGIIYLSGHFGNWELLGLVVSANGCPFNAIARPIDNHRIGRIINSLRGVLGANIFPKKAVLKDTLKCLKRGECVAILLDQNSSGEEGVFVTYFDQPAATNRGLALIAMKSGASVLPVFIIREQTYKHRVIYLPEVEIKRSDDLEGDVVRYTQEFTDVIESVVREYPEQWFWMHRRWKSRP